jgi:hypothetical protein
MIMKPITKKILFVLSLLILSVITNAAPAFGIQTGSTDHIQDPPSIRIK